MAPSSVHLPNGQNLTVTPVFGGLYFRSNDLTTHNSPLPPGWTIILNETEDDSNEDNENPLQTSETLRSEWDLEPPRPSRKQHTHRYKRPTLQNDHLFISSISNPSSSEFKPASSPTRQIGMMLWATLWWYFHQPEPDHRINTASSSQTAEEGKPHGEWKININREGIFKGKNLLPKLERMGLIATDDSSVGTVLDERTGVGWRKMFVSRRAFWQLDARIFLFTLSPVSTSPFPSSSPFPSRPGSPKQDSKENTNESPHRSGSSIDVLSRGAMTPTGPFLSSSNLPTYYPPPPSQYVFTDGVRHPLRPKPWRQGETFYTRFVPSIGQYLSFRVASLSTKAYPDQGPLSASLAMPMIPNIRSAQSSLSDPIVPTIGNLGLGASDVELLHEWMNKPRIAHAWGEDGPEEKQESFLRRGLSSRHSVPVIGCWDSRPFGYFEIYWVKEDNLGRHVQNVGDYDRGLHCLVGEEEFRGPHRVKVWLTALVHHCWLADLRTNTVYMEPRVDNTILEKYLYQAGFHKEKQISFPHKQANLMKITRDSWEKPAI